MLCPTLVLMVLVFQASAVDRKITDCSPPDQDVLDCSVEEHSDACDEIDDMERIKLPIDEPELLKAEMFIRPDGYPGIDVSWKARSAISLNFTVGFRLRYMYTSIGDVSEQYPRRARCRYFKIRSNYPSILTSDTQHVFTYRLQAIERKYRRANMYAELTPLPIPLHEPANIALLTISLKRPTTTSTASTLNTPTSVPSESSASHSVQDIDGTREPATNKSKSQSPRIADVTVLPRMGKSESDEESDWLWWYYFLTVIAALTVIVLIVLVVVLRMCTLRRRSKADISGSGKRKINKDDSQTINTECYKCNENGSVSLTLRSYDIPTQSDLYRNTGSDEIVNNDASFSVKTLGVSSYSAESIRGLHGPDTADLNGDNVPRNGGPPTVTSMNSSNCYTGGATPPTMLAEYRDRPIYTTQRSNVPLLNSPDESVTVYTNQYENKKFYEQEEYHC